MMSIYLLNVLIICLIIHLTRALENEQNGTVSLCQKRIRSCWCNTDELKLDCNHQLHFATINNDTKFITLADNFYPHSVDVSNNGLKLFNASNFLTEEQRHHIKVLDLSDNLLDNVGSFFLDAFENLRVLNLSRNHLYFYKNKDAITFEDDSPARAFNWSSTKLFDTLETLVLSSTTWRENASFPFKLLSKFKKLKRFVYDNNRLFVDTENIGYQVDTVEELSINNCGQLKNLSAEFLNMFPNLKKLWARNNKLQGFPDIFGLKNLKFLDLSRNNLRGDISTRSLQDSGVETLLLSGNEFFDFPSGAFAQFPNLTVLDISENRVALEISKDAFHYTCRNGYEECKMRQLNLEGCRINKLSESMLDWKKITNLNLKNNLFICDSDLAWLILDESIPIESGVDQAFCGLPAILGGRILRSIKKEEIQNATQTFLKQYLEKIVDCFAGSERIFFFVLGIAFALTAILTNLYDVVYGVPTKNTPN
ncbi:Negative regulator of reactive oxygen species-like isoform X2 [Aphelenchoides bicaudatus]|nr:Negative regulator of reactive oxygen species-like isoform X2 [Aphelenchoides bicaudatus]